MDQPSYQHLNIEQRHGYAVLQLDRGTANAIEQELVDELADWFARSAEDEAIGGAVLTGKARFFSAGLDLITLYNYSPEQVAAFWESFLNLVRQMTAWNKPLVASVTGHAPAGGCLLALTADHRVMAAGKYSIGLNEIPVGIAVPEPIFALYRFWIGTQKAYAMLLEGQLVLPEQALELGMVDAVRPEGEVLAEAEVQLQRYLAFDRVAWKRSKAFLRRQLLADLEMDFQQDFGPALEHWWTDEQRQRMGAIVAKLSGKAKS
jgi:enoyl-CoA hydratase/carnithine racemase